MLFAASVKVVLGQNKRRIDVIVEDQDLEKAKNKAIRQARSIYMPGKKATYTIIDIIDESEAFEQFFARMNQETEAPENPETE
ncbi:MAG TPA: hypothetical protein VHY08_15895 [Bacillota bacterium]|nr:hypothetical protein [Bacillota bacterium]